MRSPHRHAEHLAGQHIAGCLAPADDGRTRAIDPRIRPLCAAQAEFKHVVPTRGLHHAGSLCGDQRLMVDDVQQSGFKKLRLDNRRNHAQNRFAWEDDGAFRHREDLAGKMKTAEIGKKRFVKDLQAAQICDILLCKAKVLHIFNRLLQPGGYSICGDIALLTVKQIKTRPVFLHAKAQVAIHHGQLIQIGHHGQIPHAYHSLSLV